MTESSGTIEVGVSEVSSTAAEKLKLATIPHWEWVKWDGERAVTIDNLQSSFRLILHNNKQEKLITRTNWNQYNNTQNNKKNHNAHIDLILKGAAGQVIGSPIRLNVIRDYCRADGGNPQISPEQEIDLTIYDRLTTIQFNWYMFWEQEGGC